jgi:phosphoglycolate phosphatase
MYRTPILRAGDLEPMNLLFDLDGTLTDPFVGITASIRFALAQMGRVAPAPDDLRWCIGPPLMESFKRLLDTDDSKMAETALAHYRVRFGTVGLFENVVYDDIPETLAALKAGGHTLYVATAKPRVFAWRIIDHFGLRRCFKSIFGSEMDGTRSVKSDLIAHILARHNLSTSETVMIGDRGEDMAGARHNGVTACGVLWGYGSRAELKDAGAHFCLAEPAELQSTFR